MKHAILRLMAVVVMYGLAILGIALLFMAKVPATVMVFTSVYAAIAAWLGCDRLLEAIHRDAMLWTDRARKGVK